MFGRKKILVTSFDSSDEECTEELSFSYGPLTPDQDGLNWPRAPPVEVNYAPLSPESPPRSESHTR